MAQRTIHYLFGELISRQVTVRNKSRFLLGNLLPDAYERHEDRDKTHYIYRSKEENRILFDFEKFRAEFSGEMKKDDLYAGYYMHLVTDAFYRNYIRKKKLRMPSRPEDVAVLHRDYHLLNAYIVEQYGIRNELVPPELFEQEPIWQVADFHVQGMLEAFSRDLREEISGSTYYITEEILRDFVEQYVPLAVREMKAVLADDQFLRAEDYAREIVMYF